jgi:hypothetical protein
MTAGEAADKTKKLAEEAAEKAKKLAGWTGSTEEKKDGDKKEEPKETSSQKSAADKVRTDTRIKERLEKQKGKKKDGVLEDYIKFISNTCGDKKMEVFLSRKWATDDTISVFADSSNLDKSIALPANLDPLIFKDIMRLYITGISMPNSELSGAWFAKHAPAVDVFQKKDWTSDDTLLAALPKIQK